MQVAIIGGGPVGLFLARVLDHIGLRWQLFERRTRACQDARSIGIHAVSLEHLSKLRLHTAFCAAGIAVRRAEATSGHEPLASLDLSRCPPPFRFALSLPQAKTERLLRQDLLRRDATRINNNALVTRLCQSADEVLLGWQRDGQQWQSAFDFVVGCDGHDSFTRAAAGVAVSVKTYPSTFMMTDCGESTSLPPQALIALHAEGLVESFPLPDRQRRWVVQVDNPPPPRLRAATLRSLVERRTGHALPAATELAVSGFQARRQLAQRFVAGRIILAGDAAHVVTPIGGQGMNLGWLNAWDLAHTLKRAEQQPPAAQSLLCRYGRRARRRAQRTMHRGEFYMRLFESKTPLALRHALVRLMLRSPIDRFSARFFTMRGLG